MGRMSFPENLDKPARTVMATMSASSRESMILGFGNNQYRLPTVREVASMMSFPIDYRFYGMSKGTKYTLVGNAVPPKMSYAIAKAIALVEGETIPQYYIPIHHDSDIEFYNLNGVEIPAKEEKPKRIVSKFKYHIPYLIISAYRVELTNYHSDFEKKSFKWSAEIHYSQGKKKAAVFVPQVDLSDIPNQYRLLIQNFIDDYRMNAVSFNKFQELFCMTTNQRRNVHRIGPFELLDLVKQLIIVFVGQQKQMF
jgi:DNA (cytosine-5)-methyltransferase 1